MKDSEVKLRRILMEMSLQYPFHPSFKSRCENCHMNVSQNGCDCLSCLEEQAILIIGSSKAREVIELFKNLCTKQREALYLLELSNANDALNLQLFLEKNKNQNNIETF